MWNTDAGSDASSDFRRRTWPFPIPSPRRTAFTVRAAEVDGAVYDAMSNLGRNPSVGGTARRLETHIFGFSGALYGRMLRVELLEKIRDERRFDTLEELRAQIEKDREYILKLK